MAVVGIVDDIRIFYSAADRCSPHHDLGKESTLACIHTASGGRDGSFVEGSHFGKHATPQGAVRSPGASSKHERMALQYEHVVAIDHRVVNTGCVGGDGDFYEMISETPM